MEEEMKHAIELLETLISAQDIEKATTEHLPEIGDVFVQVLNKALQDANSKNDSVRMPKLQQVVSVLQKASAPPPELALLEEMLSTPDDASLEKLIEAHAGEITPEFSSVIASVMTRAEGEDGTSPSAEEAQMMEKLEKIYRAVLKYTMNKNKN
jgi:hypothetical protein